MVTRLKEINESMESIETVIKKGGNTLDTQMQLLKLYRELSDEKFKLKKELMHNA